MDKHQALRHYFGHTQFRPGQEELIDAILDRRDALGVMPTGGGKSLCYQVPALTMEGVTVVISPLISLMKDQVAALRGAGVGAAYINSTLTVDQIRGVYQRLKIGAYKLLYVAPERLNAPGFTALLGELHVPLVAVDEAHCVSQWGQDFRPSYLKISEFIASLPHRPVVAAFTATATDQVRSDIIRHLGLRNPATVVTGFDRPNLYFDVRRPRDKLSALVALLTERKDKSGIVYCATRANVEKVSQALQDRGFSATRYHAGLEEGERHANQDDFRFDRKRIMVATNAFGMGIDKSNVSFVIHYNMPKSLEAYYQEAGRAGRDGAAADCILLFSPGDVETARFLIENSGGEDLPSEQLAQVRRQDLERLRAMTGYCKTTNCLRGTILDYFGQAHGESCGHCGNCQAVYQSQDVTIPAQMVLSCVARIKERLGYYVGKTLVLQTLRGSREKRVLELGLDTLSTYGLLRDRPASWVRALVDHLEQEGYLRVNSLHATLELAPAASAVLFEGKQVTLPVRLEKPEPARRSGASDAAENTGLFDALRQERSRIAQEESVPAYLVFSNATLQDMAAKAPSTLSEFLEVSGVGEVKAKRYGQRFLAAIAAYRAAQA
jgi:ATP-dependent DNA helicase RecQ